MLRLTVVGDIRPQILYGSMKAAQVCVFKITNDCQLMVRQMGMSTQLLFTVIITLMKCAILLTYLRKPNFHKIRCATLTTLKVSFLLG